jgi:hypothetical protein
MIRKIFILFLLLITVRISYSQLEDILKKIPVAGDYFDAAVTTNIKDALPSSYWLNELDKKMQPQTDESFSSDLSSGYYRFKFNTFCLHAGTYSPTEGGYIIAPLKGSKSKLINNILSRFSEHPEIDQKDVQLLIWGIEAGFKFSSYQPDFQYRVTPLLTPEEIALMEADVNETISDLLPQQVKDALSLYGNIRNKLKDANSTYEDLERLAVKTGIAPEGKGSKKIGDGTWSSLGDGVYMRGFPDGYTKTNIEIYIPQQVNIKKDNAGRIISLDDNSGRIEFQYDGKADLFNSAKVKNYSSGEEVTIENKIASEASIKNELNDFTALVKKSLGKKKSNRLTNENLKTILQLKAIEICFKSLTDNGSETGNSVSTNALNSYISETESGTGKGGNSNVRGLSNIYGLVMAPGNTFLQRLGIGGPEGGQKKKKCSPEVKLHQISQSYLPEPQTSFNVTIDIQKNGECNVEGVRYTLFDVSKERGRCINDKESGWFDTKLDFFIDPQTNSSLNVSSDSLTAESSSEITSVNIGCSDYGAFGKLKAEVKINGNWITAKDENSNSNFIRLPFDDDGNNIADIWETQNNVKGLAASWDDESDPSGQATNGDGLTNYEEYRGCYVNDEFTGITHIRTNPKKKELFVIDKDNLFVSFSFEKASGIKSYYLTENLIYGDKSGTNEDFYDYRKVDFNSTYAAGHKYSLIIVKVNGMTDPYGINQKPTCFGYCPVGPPKYANRTVIFPDRKRWFLVQEADTLDSLLKANPLQKTILIKGTPFPRASVQNYVDACNNQQKLDLLTDFFVNRTTIHEVGHGCGIEHHKQIGGGNIDCPIRYVSDVTTPIFLK